MFEEYTKIAFIVNACGRVESRSKLQEMVYIGNSGEINGLFDLIDELDIIRSLYNVDRTELRTHCPGHLKKDLKEFLSHG